MTLRSLEGRSSNIKLKTGPSRVYTPYKYYQGVSGLAGRVMKLNIKYCCVSVHFGGFGENIELLDRPPLRFWSSRTNIKWPRLPILHRELVNSLPDLGRELQPRTQAAYDLNLEIAKLYGPRVLRTTTVLRFLD